MASSFFTQINSSPTFSPGRRKLKTKQIQNFFTPTRLLSSSLPSTSKKSGPNLFLKPSLNYKPSADPTLVSRKGKKAGKSKKSSGIRPSSACEDSPVLSIEDYQLSDDNIRHRNLVLLKEAMLTLEISNTLGLIPIEDEGRIVKHFMSIEEEEMAISDCF